MPGRIKFICSGCGRIKHLGDRPGYSPKERYCVHCHGVTFEREPAYVRIHLEKRGTDYYLLKRLETNVECRRGRVLVTTWTGTRADPTEVYVGQHLNRHQAHQLTQDMTNTVIGLEKEDENLPYFYNDSIYRNMA